jgi:NADH-quinone oxidoreductase subunit G
VDRVLTTRELARMIRARGIAFGALPDDGNFDDPLGESTGAGQLFGASGGVMEAMVRTTSHLLKQERAPPLEWQQLRGMVQGIKTTEVPGIGRVAVCNGIAAAQRLLQTQTWREEFVAIEVMACVGGCLGGGGEPKSMDPLILEKRVQAIYAIDRQAPRRRSDENQTVQRLYATELQYPNSARAHALLHTSFAARKSKRLFLQRFLDCVDRRDGAGAVALLHPEASWSTASPFGDIEGAAAVQAFIETRLPPREWGPGYARHRMAEAADIEDLTVITPSGERCRFSVDLEIPADGSPSGMRIRKLARDSTHGADALR